MQDRNRIEQRLSLVSRLHTMLGILGVILSIFLGAGTWIAHFQGDEPSDVRLILDIISALGILGGLLLSIGLIAVGSAIRKRIHHALCVVVSVLLLPCIPFGTAVGSYSLYVLLDQEIKKWFDTNGTQRANQQR